MGHPEATHIFHRFSRALQRDTAFLSRRTTRELAVQTGSTRSSRPLLRNRVRSPRASPTYTGELLWQFQTGNGIHDSPMTYSVGGKQYVAVPTGWGGWIKGFAPELYGAPRGHALVVFSLP
jgi:hypothetical protein